MKSYKWSEKITLLKAETDFDKLLKSEWKDKMSKGFFLYPFEAPQAQRVLTPGKYNFLLQCNPSRFTKRKKPEVLTSINTPMDEDKFHFGKIDKEKEILFELTDESGRDNDHFVIINNSPFELGHSLLIPELSSLRNQTLSLKAIEVCLRTMFLSGSPGFRLGFNSMCAKASVNHCHWHIYYLPYYQYVQTCELVPLHGNFLWTFKEYSAPAFIFRLYSDVTENLLMKTVKNVHTLTEYLMKEEIPFNVLVIRAPNDEVRIILWARNPILNDDCSAKHDLAVCRLGGHIIVQSEEEYNSFTENQLIETHIETVVEKFHFVKSQLQYIFST